MTAPVKSNLQYEVQRGVMLGTICLSTVLTEFVIEAIRGEITVSQQSWVTGVYT